MAADVCSIMNVILEKVCVILGICAPLCLRPPSGDVAAADGKYKKKKKKKPLEREFSENYR